MTVRGRANGESVKLKQFKKEIPCQVVAVTRRKVKRSEHTYSQE